MSTHRDYPLGWDSAKDETYVDREVEYMEPEFAACLLEHGLPPGLQWSEVEGSADCDIEGRHTTYKWWTNHVLGKRVPYFVEKEHGKRGFGLWFAYYKAWLMEGVDNEKNRYHGARRRHDERSKG